MVSKPILSLCVCLSGLLSVAAFVPHAHLFQSTRSVGRARRQVKMESTETFLAQLPDEVRKLNCIFEMVYVERIPMPEKTTGGLFLPSDDTAQMNLVRIISVGEGVVGESGVTARSEGLVPGDFAFTKQPWGIGPRDDQFDGRKFSFVRAKDVLAVANAK